MKLKSLLIFAACGTMLPVAAQSHHGYYTIPEQADIDAFNENNTSAVKTLNCWATPKLTMPVEKADKTLESSNIYNNNTSDMIVRPTTMNKIDNSYFTKLTGTSVSFLTKWIIREQKQKLLSGNRCRRRTM